jgi:hypothetical protein
MRSPGYNQQKDRPKAVFSVALMEFFEIRLHGTRRSSADHRTQPPQLNLCGASKPCGVKRSVPSEKVIRRCRRDTPRDRVHWVVLQPWNIRGSSGALSTGQPPFSQALPPNRHFGGQLQSKQPDQIARRCCVVRSGTIGLSDCRGARERNGEVRTEQRADRDCQGARLDQRGMAGCHYRRGGKDAGTR